MDVVVTVPMARWADWIDEGDLPGDEPDEAVCYSYHFWIPPTALPRISPGERVYIVAHGKLRGYAPLTGLEHVCRLEPYRACLLREGGAVAVTIARSIKGFQGWRYRSWDYSDERPFPEWRMP